MRRAVIRKARTRIWPCIVVFSLFCLLVVCFVNIYQFASKLSISSQSSPVIETTNVQQPNKVPRKAKYFFFDPYKRLTCAQNFSKKYGMIAKRVDKGRQLFDYFNPQNYPYRNLFALLDVPAIELSKHYDQLGKDLTTVPPYEITSMCANKLLFNRYLHENGFSEFAPKVYNSIDDIPKYPVIIKPLNGTGSSLVFAAENRQVLEWHIRKHLSGRSYLLQESIHNRIQRIIHVSAIDGRLLRMVCYERDLEKPLAIYPNKWKTTPEALKNEDCHLDLVKGVLSSLKFTGIGDFDLKVQTKEDGVQVPKIIEFNPRIPGTVRRDENLLADFICSLQWNGTGKLVPAGGSIAPGCYEF